MGIMKPNVIMVQQYKQDLMSAKYFISGSSAINAAVSV
jgi:hypothetical protein